MAAIPSRRQPMDLEGHFHPFLIVIHFQLGGLALRRVKEMAQSQTNDHKQKKSDRLLVDYLKLTAYCQKIIVERL